MNTNTSTKSKSITELFQRTEKLTNTILTATNKTILLATFKELECIATGECICDTCPEWGNDIFLVYEFVRCLIPSRVFQLIKEVHIRTPRWKWMKKAYTSLYNTVYDDLNPKTGNLSNGSMEDQPCTYQLNKDTVKKAYVLMSKEFEERRAAKQQSNAAQQSTRS
jgi:hypothetical protein